MSKYIMTGLLLVVLVLAVLDAQDGDTKNTTGWCHDKFAALAISQDFVKERLKAPSTAEFPWNVDRYKISDDQNTCTYSIVGYVDSQNSFGAQIRSNWEVLVRWQPGEKTWHLDYITIR